MKNKIFFVALILMMVLTMEAMQTEESTIITYIHPEDPQIVKAPRIPLFKWPNKVIIVGTCKYGFVHEKKDFELNKMLVALLSVLTMVKGQAYDFAAGRAMLDSFLNKKQAWTNHQGRNDVVTQSISNGVILERKQESTFFSKFPWVAPLGWTMLGCSLATGSFGLWKWWKNLY